MRLSIRLVVILCVGLAACGYDSSSPTTPSVASVHGNWSGNMTDAAAGPGTMSFALAQSGSSVTGTWSTAAPNGASSGGSLTGSVNGSSFTATLSPSAVGSCSMNATATINGSQMSGTYSGINCSVPVSGTFSIGKQ